jgi:S-methylmethionine-dependent homocysteine/selenocysteine methylase
MCQQNKIDFSTPILTDGGLETDFIFNRDIDLPHFASFPLLERPDHKEIFGSYYREYLELAKTARTGFILESPTWRASADWGFKLGYSKDDLCRLNKQAIEMLKEIRAEYEDTNEQILISGCIGPRFDGYVFEKAMTAEQSKEFNSLQIKVLKEACADFVSVLTMTNIDEALGVALAAQEHEIDVVVSFTVELDGNLPSGERLEDAVNRIDEITDGYPIYYMINCAHPSHFAGRLAEDGSWKLRVKGVQANASCKSHEELDNATELDPGDKEDLAAWHLTLKKHLPNLMIYGGCCGTDISHVRSICEKIIQ